MRLSLAGALTLLAAHAFAALPPHYYEEARVQAENVVVLRVSGSRALGSVAAMAHAVSSGGWKR